MTRLKLIIALILILGIATFLRLYLITELPPGLYPDEAMNGNNALEAIETGEYKIFYPENNGREGMFINIQAFFLGLIGKNEPWILRLPSAIFGILTVLGVFLLTKELFKKESVALLSSFLLATSFWHINFSRIGFRAIMAPLLLTWGIYLLLVSFKRVSNFDIRYSDFLFPLLAGTVYGLGFHTYIAYRATPLILLPIFWYYRHHPHFIKIKITFAIAVLLAFLPLGLYFLENPQDFFGRTAQVSIFSGENPIKDLGLNILKTFGAFNFIGDWNWRHNYAGQPLLFWPVGIFFIIGLVMTSVSMIKNLKFKVKKYNSKFKNSDDPIESTKIFNFAFLILILWLLVASLPVIISNEGLPHSLRMILMIPPVFILAGYGGIWLYTFLKTKINTTYLKPATFIFISLLILESYTIYFIKWGKNKEVEGAFAKNYAEIGKEINNVPTETPKYIVVEANGVDVRGFPMPTQTIMFLTNTFRKEEQKKKNIHYVLLNQINEIPSNAALFYIK